MGTVQRICVGNATPTPQPATIQLFLKKTQGLRLRRYIIADNFSGKKTLAKVPHKWSLNTQIDGNARCLKSLKWMRSGTVTFPNDFRHATTIMLTVDAKEDRSKPWKLSNEQYYIRLEGDNHSVTIRNWGSEMALPLEDLGFESFDQVRKIKIRHVSHIKRAYDPETHHLQVKGFKEKTIRTFRVSFERS